MRWVLLTLSCNFSSNKQNSVNKLLLLFPPMKVFYLFICLTYLHSSLWRFVLYLFEDSIVLGKPQQERKMGSLSKILWQIYSQRVTTWVLRVVNFIFQYWKCFELTTMSENYTNESMCHDMSQKIRYYWMKMKLWNTEMRLKFTKFFFLILFMKILLKFSEIRIVSLSSTLPFGLFIKKMFVFAQSIWLRFIYNFSVLFFSILIFLYSNFAKNVFFNFFLLFFNFANF